MNTNDPVPEMSDLYAAEGGPRAIFSAKVADYQASRPGYPREVFEAVKVFCPPSPDSWVVEVGAGTGLFTRGLLAHGFQVLAVEPNPEMRAAAEAQLRGYGGCRVVEGSAEHLPFATGSASAVMAAQSFHWFEVEQSRTEFLRVLNPHGLVILVWNDRIITDPLHRELDELFARFGGTARGVILAHEDRSAVPMFFGGSKTYQFVWPHTQILDEAGFLSLVFSRSYMPARECDKGLAVATAAKVVFEKFASAGKISVHYQTVAIIGRPI